MDKVREVVGDNAQKSQGQKVLSGTSTSGVALRVKVKASVDSDY